MFSGFKPTTGKSNRHASSHGSHGSSASHHKSHSHRSSNANRSSTTTVAPSGPTLPADTSFLFVVNELQINLEPNTDNHPGGGGPAVTAVPRDQWFNTMPPQQSAAYTSETPGVVFRYTRSSGLVTPAPNYAWYRQTWNQTPGRIVRLDPQTSIINGFPIPYDNPWGSSTQTIFSCSPHLPVIISEADATLGGSFMRRHCPCDRRCDGDGDDDDDDDNNNTACSPWNILHFGSGQETNNNCRGVSFVNAKAAGHTSVVGRDPSWMPSLVPLSYRNSRGGIPDSRGLSGQLPTVIGLMAFHGPPGRASSVFLNGRWAGNRWVGSSHAPRHVPRGGDEPPRGFLVQVCLDNLQGDLPDNEANNLSTEACMANLERLEWRDVLVRD
ncbi:hypothetical protein QBC44DRAFT_373827 [Cladorrhinum sp. PSN332]|nr:hypothetical protein QBC44DRAFT_373827 [Cladorrhinum sp. PSN332]